MRQAPLLYLLLVLLLVLLVPAMFLRGPATPAPDGDETEQPGESPAAHVAPLDAAIAVQVYVPAQGAIEPVPLETYVARVIAAEMPPGFGDEALKAQAVLARTYAVRKMRLFGGPGGCAESEAADVCGDFRDQAYVTYEELEQRLGRETAAGYWQRILAAVAATAGEIVTYEGEPIAAVYHSTSAGTTEDAAEVWGHAYPYLKPVPSDDKTSTRYMEEKRVPLTQLAAALGPAAVPAATTDAVVTVNDRTAGGRVRTVSIGDTTMAATDVRRLLGLRSTNFTVVRDGDDLVFTTLGYGHGVGMSQFGANEMAAAGHNYRDIIQYYYSGVEIHHMFTE